MRIDRYLFFIRLAKSRTLAQSLVDEGHIRIDGRRVEKSSDEVRVGSVLALPLHGRVRVLKVLCLPERRGPAPEARACYEDLRPLREGQALTRRGPRHSEAPKGALTK